MRRLRIQILAALVTNSYWEGFVKATIYKGPIKYVCHPGLQCYSCPSSITACPIGALQNAFASLRKTLSVGQFHIGLYIIGFLGVIGILFGRLVCGWVCPFGLLQDLLYKIPTPKLRLPHFASYGKYLMLAVLVILVPILASFYSLSFTGEEGQFVVSIAVNESGVTYPWYCKLVCPAGTFEACIPKILLDAEVRESLGFWFRLKWTILIVFLLWMVLTPRAFCRVGCPLGALYGLFNKFSLYRLSVNKEKCTKCGQCEKVCPMDIRVYETPNHTDCIRCLDCVSACRLALIRKGFLRNEKAKNI